MCGIAGIIHENRDAHELAAALRRMTDAIFHRGPDDDGEFIDNGVAIGMRRLSIIDIEGGTQPIFNESERYAVVFNGEIYNYRELRPELEQRGHSFRTNSDTEVIVHLFEEYGPACVDHLRGMFAFAVWDRLARKLFVARDRLGIKPLYYTQADGGLHFGSEIKSLLAARHGSPTLNVAGLNDYLSLKYVPAPATLFEGVFSLPPGHWLRFDEQGLEIQRYWDLSFAPQPGPRASDDEYAQRLEHLLRESVRLRLRSDVPFGAFLSGGLDSSTIVALMSELLDGPVNTFSVGFDGGREADELPYARDVANRFGAKHREIVVRADDFVNLAEKVTWHLDQPIADQATAATYMVAQLAAQHVKMVLTGEGGDELFAGYARYQGERFAPWLRPIPAAVRSLLRGAVRFAPGLRREKIAAYALLQDDEAARLANWFPLFNDDAKSRVLSQAMAGSVKSRSAAALFASHLHETDAQGYLNRMLHVDTRLWLPDYLLLRGDKLTMANSLEARVPLLDHKLVEFAARLPADLKLRGKTGKFLLKKVAGKLLPSEIVHRKKQGFPIPIADWMRGEARSFILDLLSPSAVRRRGLFDPRQVATLIRQHDRGHADHSVLLWGLANVELWQRVFLSPPADQGRHAPAPLAGIVSAKKDLSYG